MATIEQMEKKRTRQIEQVLAVVENMAAEVAAMKVELSRPEIVELEAPADRTGEIFAAIGGASAETGKQLERAIDVLAKIAGEIIIMKSEIAELKALVQPTKPPATHRGKK